MCVCEREREREGYCINNAGMCLCGKDGGMCVRVHVCVCVWVREREGGNSKTLFYKDCSLGSVKNLSSK